jgi:hypothetical protein
MTGINIATFEIETKADPPERRTPSSTDVHRRLVEDRGVIARDANLEQTAETARDTLASIHATNGNHSTDDTEPHRKTLACGCSTTSDPSSDDLIETLNGMWDRMERHKQADDARVKVATFDINAA